MSAIVQAITIRPIAKEDNAHVASIIRNVMTEFGASGEGFAIHDDEVANMADAYAVARHRYFVAEDGNGILGGAGIAPLTGLTETTCELRKMYVLSEGRGRGVGQALLSACLAFAREQRFRQVYLETTPQMIQAQGLYVQFGFRRIPTSMGQTGHHGCQVYFLKELTA